MPISKATTQDTVAVLSQTAAGWATGTATVVPIVGQLLVAAGVQMAIPGIGWITAGATAAVAGTIALVMALRRGKMRKQQAVEQARALGIPDAEEVPAFTVQALGNGPAWRGRQAGKLIQRVQRQVQKHGPSALQKKSNQKDLSRIKVLATLDLLDRAEARGTPVEPPAAPVPVLAQEYGSRPASVEGYLGADGAERLGLLVLLGVAGVITYNIVAGD